MSQTQLGKDLRIKVRTFWPISLLAVVMLVTLVTIGLALVDEFDRNATVREQTVVESGIAQRLKEIAKLPLPQIVWDEAVRNLDNKFDFNWAEKNIGIYLSQTDRFDGSYVLDDADTPLFAYRDGKTAPAASYAGIASAAAPLVAEVRRLEAERSTSAGDGRGDLGKPIQSTGIVGEAGDIHILTASLIQPDFGTVRIKGRRAPVLVTDMKVDGEFLTQFADRFLLNGLHVHPGDSRLEPEEAHVALRTRVGRYVATIDWLPQKPGTALLNSVGIAALALIVMLVFSVLYFYHRVIRMAEGRLLSEARTEYLIRHDALTGLPNRLSFMEKLEIAIGDLQERKGPLAVLSIDLDDFEKISETHGHRAADEYLEEAARRMAQCCRSSDVLARFAADEFSLFMAGPSANTAAKLAARLCAAVAEPIDLSCGRIFPGCSIGVVQLTAGEGASAAETLRQADLAMHRAKETARGGFCQFEPEMDIVVKERRALEVELRRALADDALELHYQPQVDRHGYVTGVEALVRWSHPERGMVSPALFVPVAERCGLIMALGMFTLRRAFEDSRRWPGLKVAINVSATQIMNEEFVPRLANLIKDMGVDTSQFELEITEGILINDAPETQQRLRILRDLGFALALDDFGTGYSSLSYLSRYPVGKIKIDRSFVSNLGEDAAANAVVSAIISLARALKLAVIAEGVETASQQIQLARSGCFNIQGFLYSRPIHAEDLDQIYLNGRVVAPKPLLAA